MGSKGKPWRSVATGRLELPAVGGVHASKSHPHYTLHMSTMFSKLSSDIHMVALENFPGNGAIERKCEDKDSPCSLIEQEHLCRVHKNFRSPSSNEVLKILTDSSIERNWPGRCMLSTTMSASRLVVLDTGLMSTLLPRVLQAILHL